MRKGEKGRDAGRMISAAEIACFACCPEQWRLEYGLGVAAGTRHHARKAVAERMAGGSITLGRIMAATALVVLLLLLWRWL